MILPDPITCVPLEIRESASVYGAKVAFISHIRRRGIFFSACLCVLTQALIASFVSGTTLTGSVYQKSAFLLSQPQDDTLIVNTRKGHHYERYRDRADSPTLRK